ncbi:uncharacterized protein LOC113744544 isoform X1 [Larimichthys crocea]|uniref:uncharacterized protein LOC113744544 isoform X1 n=2 Tax=Larimichthys crocea TaxID=215358 RepID=UPI000F5E691A|nr:uncharacterized protein LOC113744544 isoform X1 [Larimichthys crocea]
MLRSFFLLFLLCENTVKSTTTDFPVTSGTPASTYNTIAQTTANMSTSTTEEMPSSVELLATPDYPVAAGQRVSLHCSASYSPASTVWIWERHENQTWQEVGSGTDLILTEPEQSGEYRCRAMRSIFVMSDSHTVYIVSMHATVGENLGIAAFVFSLLALMINIAIIFWLYSRRLNDTPTTLNTAARGFAVPEKSPEGNLPKIDNDADVYMNYTSTNQAYSDLDQANMNTDNVYSSLS